MMTYIEDALTALRAEFPAARVEQATEVKSLQTDPESILFYSIRLPGLRGFGIAAIDEWPVDELRAYARDMYERTKTQLADNDAPTK